jgi:hypothetical protein
VTAEPAARRDALHAKAGHAFFASFLGWTLDAFDFFVLVFVLPAVAEEFHRTVADVAYSITLTLAMRPVGALLFGWLADRYGRRIPLMIDVVFYSVVEVLSGLAPDYTTFLWLRALYGIGMGGEWGVGASLAMEAVLAKRRGLLWGFSRKATPSDICSPPRRISSSFPPLDGGRSSSSAERRHCSRCTSAAKFRSRRPGSARDRIRGGSCRP